MTAEMHPAASRPLQTTFYVVATLIGIVFILTEWREIFIPIALAILIWYVILALSLNLSRISVHGYRLPQPVCTLTSIVLVLIAGLLFVNLMAASAAALTEGAPRYEQQLETLLSDLAQLLGKERALSLEQIRASIDSTALVRSVVTSVASFALDAIIIFFYVVFLLVQQQYVPKKLALMIPEEQRRKRVVEVMRRIHGDLQVYIGVMVLLAVVTGTITYVVLVIVGIDFAVLWSVVIALLSFIPTIGTMLGIAFPALIALLQFDSYTPFLIVLVTLGTAQLTLNNLAQPALMGRSLSLSPFFILVALSIWGTIWGILGAVLSVPITVAAMIIMSNIAAARPVAVALSLKGEID